MDSRSLSLSALVGRHLFPGEGEALARLMLGAYVLLADARPFIGVLNEDGDTLSWATGGAGFSDLLRPPHSSQGSGNGGALKRLSDVLSRLGVSEMLIGDIAKVVHEIEPGRELSYRRLLRGKKRRSFRIVLYRRRILAGGEVQFSIHEMTYFECINAKMRTIAETILSAMGCPLSNGDPRDFIGVLQNVDKGLRTLFSHSDDRRIAEQAQNLAAEVSAAASRLVRILNGIDIDETDGKGDQGRGKEKCMPPDVHCVLGRDWQSARDMVLTRIGGELALKGDFAHSVRSAHEFMSNSTVIFIIAPHDGEYYVLSGPHRGEIYWSIPELVRGIEVGSNSRRSAEIFFSSLGQRESQTCFAMGEDNVEVWGRPGLGAGWQAMIANAHTQGVDVRTMFHGLKNLWLHLQVLHVVKTKADVDEVRDALLETVDKIHRRIGNLKEIAKSSAPYRGKIHERVAEWFKGALRISNETGIVLDVRVPQDVLDSKIECYGEQMEDTLGELVLNAHHYGARRVLLNGAVKGGYLEIEVVDDGRGMSPEKLAQARKVVNERRFDPVLSARSGGSGYGLLGAAQAVARFVDGQMRLEPVSAERGLKVILSFRLAGLT